MTGPVGGATSRGVLGPALDRAVAGTLALAGAGAAAAALDHDAALPVARAAASSWSDRSTAWHESSSVEPREIGVDDDGPAQRSVESTARARALEAGEPAARVDAAPGARARARASAPSRGSAGAPPCGALRPQPAQVLIGLGVVRRPRSLGRAATYSIGTPSFGSSSTRITGARRDSSVWSGPATGASPGPGREHLARLRLAEHSAVDRHRLGRRSRRPAPRARARTRPRSGSAPRRRPARCDASSWCAGTPQYFEPGSDAFGQRLPFVRIAAQRPEVSPSSPGSPPP